MLLLPQPPTYPPIQCVGDIAVGNGVTRYIFSLMMKKLKYGFQLNLGL